MPKDVAFLLVFWLLRSLAWPQTAVWNVTQRCKKTRLSWSSLDCARVWLYSLPVYRGRILKPLSPGPLPELRACVSPGTYLHVASSPCQLSMSLCLYSLGSFSHFCRSCWSSDKKKPYVQGTSPRLYATKVLWWYWSLRNQILDLKGPRCWCK